MKTRDGKEFCVLIKYLFLMEKSAVQAKQWVDKCYSDSVLSTRVIMWYATFNIVTNDAEWSGPLNSAVVPENINKFHKIVLADLKLKLHEITEKLKISEGILFTILHENLSMTQLYSKWVSCSLSVNQK